MSSPLGSSAGQEWFSVFRNAAARDSNWPHPRIGQTCLLMDTGSLLVFYGPLHGYAPPWNTSWGEQTRTVSTATTPLSFDQSEHEILGLRTSFTATHNRKYRIGIEGQWDSGDSLATSQAWIRTYRGVSGGAHALVGDAKLINLPLGLNGISLAFTVESTFDTGPVALYFTQQAQDAFGISSGSNQASIVTVDDVGASAPPVYG